MRGILSLVLGAGLLDAQTSSTFSGESRDQTGRPLSSFGKIRSTVAESRQIQLGLRISF